MWVSSKTSRKKLHSDCLLPFIEGQVIRHHPVIFGSSCEIWALSIPCHTSCCLAPSLLLGVLPSIRRPLGCSVPFPSPGPFLATGSPPDHLMPCCSWLSRQIFVFLGDWSPLVWPAPLDNSAPFWRWGPLNAHSSGHTVALRLLGASPPSMVGAFRFVRCSPGCLVPFQ